jgi:hypothetical protein
MTHLNNEKGAALIVTLMMIAGLAVIGGIIVVIAASEKQVVFNESTHMRSFYSADAGGEAAINWLRTQGSPPDILDGANNVFVPSGQTSLSSDHRYQFGIQYTGKRPRPGWSKEWKDFDYLVDSDGESVRDSRSEVELQTSRLFQEGY